MKSNKIPKILILGGGYVTITATRGLRKAIQNNEVEVTVVSRENFHCFHGFVGEMITGRVSTGSIISPVRRIFAPASIHIAQVEQIHLEEQKVTVRRLEDGSCYDLNYDHLLLAMGTADNLDVYPGLREHGHCLKTYEQCFRLKNHILNMFEQASICDDEAKRRSMLTFVVAGGGYAGTEIAGEMADFVRLLTKKEYAHIQRDECRVILVSKASTLLPELFKGKGASGYGNGHPTLVHFATEHAKKLGVDIRLDTQVKKASANAVYLTNGEIISTHTIINAVGTKAQSVIESLDLVKDEKGRVIVNGDGTVKGWNMVWAGGDCAALPHPKGDYCPSVGIFALKSGAHFAKNVMRKIKSQPTKKFSYIGLGQGVSIGKRTAVVELKGVRIKGIIAWLLWRILLVYYFPTWDRRLRLIADWLIWPIVGRDIAEMKIGNKDQIGIRMNRYPKGELICKPAKEKEMVHLITEGIVELVYNFIPIETLHTGDYIESSMYHQYEGLEARASSDVKTISMKRKDAQIVESIYSKKQRQEMRIPLS